MKGADAGRSRMLKWVVGGSVGVGLALVVAAVVWCWPISVVAGVVQPLGLWFTALGVAVVRSWLEQPSIPPWTPSGDSTAGGHCAGNKPDAGGHAVVAVRS